MNFLTFDVEDWFHILDNNDTMYESQWSNYESRIEIGLNKIFSVLENNSQKASFFCLGWIAEKYRFLINQIDN